MFVELKEYLKKYRLTAKEFSHTLKKDSNLVPFNASFNTNFCQYLCGYYFGLVNLFKPKQEFNYYNIYGLNTVVNNIVQNKVFDNPFSNQIEQKIDIFPFIDRKVLDVIESLNLTDFLVQTSFIFDQITNEINNTQTEPLPYDLLLTNVITWTIYLIINDKLTNAEIESVNIVDLWISALTTLTSLITEQLKTLIGPSFGLILEFISNIVLYM